MARPWFVKARQDGAEAINAIGAGYRFTIGLEIGIAPGEARVVGMQVDAVVVGLPDFNKGSLNRPAIGIVNDAR